MGLRLRRMNTNRFSISPSIVFGFSLVRRNLLLDVYQTAHCLQLKRHCENVDVFGILTSVKSLHRRSVNCLQILLCRHFLVAAEKHIFSFGIFRLML